MNPKARPPRDVPALRAALARLRLPGGQGGAVARARALLDVYLETAEAHGESFEATARALRAGVPAIRLGGAELSAQTSQPGNPAETAACAPGCAWCCVLSGADGGVILEAEARRVHAALTPLTGQRDGREWMEDACPALDPDTRMCRIYEARPMICRTYLSDDAEACRAIAHGTPASGPGVLGAQSVYLAAHSLARAALKGLAQVPTYALAKVAAEALAGADEEAALKAARHKPKVLEDERARMGGSL
jgi:hypothetical protein